MAATSAAMVMRNPADAARAPLGPTNTTTGTSDSMIAVLMSRVESTRPPGVRSTRTTTSASRATASSRVWTMNSAEAGWMRASTSATWTTGVPRSSPASAAGASRRSFSPAAGVSGGSAG